MTSAPPNGTLNQKRIMYYSEDWQLVEERIDDAAHVQEPQVNRHMQYVWGRRYIDDIILRRQNKNFTNDDPEVTYEDVWYHITDTLFSTVAIIDKNAKLVERVSYDAYGRARHHPVADLSGDGQVTQIDRDLMVPVGSFGFGDFSRTGVVDSLDVELVQRPVGRLPKGQISTTDNIIGWCGYVFNAEIGAHGMYTVRFRHYEPDLGRWITRDPLGYVDGMSLYEYGRSNTQQYRDPFGLKCEPGATQYAFLGMTVNAASEPSSLRQMQWEKWIDDYIGSLQDFQDFISVINDLKNIVSGAKDLTQGQEKMYEWSLEQLENLAPGPGDAAKGDLGKLAERIKDMLRPYHREQGHLFAGFEIKTLHRRLRVGN